MLKKTVLVTLILMIVCTVSYSAVIYYDDPISIGVGARAIGMGRAYNAIVDDSNAVFINPAGLGSQRTANLSSMQTDFIGEFPYTMVSGAIPIKNYGTMGIGYVNSRSKEILVTGGGTAYSFNQALVFSYGGYVGETFKPFLGDEYHIYSGISAKYFSKGFAGDATANASGMNFDYGLKYLPTDRVSFGLTLYNLLYNSKIAGDIDPEDMPTVVRLGGAYEWKEINLKIAVDKEMHFGRDIPWPAHLGMEWHGNEFIYLRAGVDQLIGTAGGILNNATTLGVGLEFEGLRVDLAYMNNFSDIGISSTFLSISYYGQDSVKKEEAAAGEPIKTEEPKPAPVPEAVKVVPVVQETITQEPSKKIDILFPSKNAVTYLKEIQIVGSVEGGYEDTLWVDGKNVEVKQDHMFTADVPLSIGKNEKTFRLIDGNVLEAIASRKIFRYYMPADLTQGEEEQRPIEYKVIDTKIFDYLGKDYTLDKRLSRQLMALIIAKAKGLAVTPEAENVATDVSINHWAANYITGVIRSGVMTAYADGSFQPDKLVSKFELAQLMAKATGTDENTIFSYLAGKPLDDFATFTDLIDVMYYTGYLSGDVKEVKGYIGL
jgi:hypothetical protein